jgi:hypothetical protein
LVLIKLFYPFAWVETGAGVLLTTLYQLCFTTAPAAILRRMGGDIPLE